MNHKSPKIVPTNFDGLISLVDVEKKAKEICAQHTAKPLSLSSNERTSLQTNGTAFVCVVGDIYSQHNASIVPGK